MAKAKKKARKTRRKPGGTGRVMTRAQAVAARKKLEIAIKEVNKRVSDLISDFYFGM
jgi:hypothetical protein